MTILRVPSVQQSVTPFDYSDYAHISYNNYCKNYLRFCLVINEQKKKNKINGNQFCEKIENFAGIPDFTIH